MTLWRNNVEEDNTGAPLGRGIHEANDLVAVMRTVMLLCEGNGRGIHEANDLVAELAWPLNSCLARSRHPRSQ